MGSVNAQLEDGHGRRIADLRVSVTDRCNFRCQEHTANWLLSRGVAGVRGRTLVVNFPGSPRSIGQAAEPLIPALPHALQLLAGESPHH